MSETYTSNTSGYSLYSYPRGPVLPVDSSYRAGIISWEIFVFKEGGEMFP